VPDSSLPTVPNEYVPFALLLPVIVAANGRRAWQHRTAQQDLRLTRLEHDRAEAERLATERERARIARELHDVVTHHVSMMIIQAGAARKIMTHAPADAEEALLAVEAGGREAMTELRHVMGLLTTDTGDTPPTGPALTPQPGLHQLDLLIERVRDSGLPVQLDIHGDAEPLPAAIGLAAYRVIQEALTNTMKHTTDATATVELAYTGHQLSVTVTDTGSTIGPNPIRSSGHGLTGLRERVTLHGGVLHAGPQPAGGFEVRATFPLEAL
jgi:signal transduction histidine kinase